MYIIITLVQIISTEVICIVQLMAILLAAGVSDKAMDYTMVMLIAMFLFIWLIFYLFNVLWRDDDDDQLLQSQVSIYYIIDNDIIDCDIIRTFHCGR